jgi:sensor histidine kinase regulating citrate/malate metabolism
VGARTLARQFLVWQLGIVALLLVVVAVVAAAQSNAAFRETQGRRMLSVAEDVAATASVRQSLATGDYGPLPSLGESARALSSADDIVIVDAGLVVRSAADPDDVDEPFALGESTAAQGRSWVGNLDGSTVDAQAPVIADDGRVVGLVAARVEAPSLLTTIAASPAPTVTLLGLALVLGVAGSLLLAQRVRRQTLGLEPAEIVELVQRREAMLLGVKEGVIGLDRADRITLLNSAAEDLLDIDGPGRSVHELGLDDRLRDVLTGAVAGEDQVVLHGSRVLVLNRMPVEVDGVAVGAVVTLRDRTELAALEHRLDASRHITDTLRAQTHEFTNRLHTIAGLIELGEYDEVRRFVSGIVAGSDQWRRDVTARVGDAAVAALLVAKASLATERGAELRLAPDSRLPAVDPVRDPALSADLVTVLGNLVDNALDATALNTGPGWVEVGLACENGEVRVRVRDSGPGVASELAEEVFRHGFSTKAAEHNGGGRGLGLALARQVCLRRGGAITLRNNGGAVFDAYLPISEASP